MRFGISARSLFRTGYGASRMLRDLLRAISRQNTAHEIILFLDRPLTGDFSDLDPFTRRIIPLNTDNPAKRFIWDHFLLGKAALKEKIDCLLCPLHVRPFYSPIPTLVIIHDMMYHLFPDEWSIGERWYMRLGVTHLSTRASALTFISHSTQHDFSSFFPDCAVRQEVIYPGVSQLPPNDGVYTAPLPRPFIFAIGSSYPRKKIEILISVFREIHSKVPQDLVIAGSLKLRLSLKEALEGIEQRVHFTGLVEDRELAQLYSQADFFVFPSKYEGFGLPLLEAMHHGCPVACSDGGALPEIAGNAALIFTRDDPQALKAVLLTLANDPHLRTQLSELGRQRAKEFSYDTAAAQYLKLMEEIGSCVAE